MTIPRATWKGTLKFGEVTAPVALYAAASQSERVSFHTLNRKTGNRVRREFIDMETEDLVERGDQIKGYELEDGRYVVLEPDEIADLVPDSDKTLRVDAFIPCCEVDDVYFEKPYYLIPERLGVEAFSLLRDGMAEANVAALARTVIFRRLRTFLIRPHGKGLIGTTLNFNYEVRSAEDAFEDVADLKIKGEMLDLAKHIIGTKLGRFDPEEFDDRYENALAQLIKAKIEGRPLPRKAPLKPSKPADLLEALRKSATLSSKKEGRTSTKRKTGKISAGTKKAASPKREKSTQSRRRAG